MCEDADVNSWGRCCSLAVTLTVGREMAGWDGDGFLLEINLSLVKPWTIDEEFAVILPGV